MSFILRAATLAAMTFCTIYGASSAPSLAETVTSTVSAFSNEAQTAPVPAVTVEPLPAVAPPSIDDAVISRAPAEEPEAPKSLAQLVAMQDIPARLDHETEC
ncbi:MAG TPA: hypothetical protein VE567_02505, partial [Sphingomonas sp.]|nr:hypothetical protein [Sphingomonas sp.]